MVYPDRPWWIKAHGHRGVRFLNLVNGGRSPRGQEFRDAVRKLCELAGKECPLKERVLSEEEEEEARRREARRAVLDDLNAYCQEVLWSPQGEKARAYLHEGRGLTDEDIRALGLGFYLSAAEVRRELLARGHALEDCRQAGVMRTRLEGFITIPWADEHGQPLTVYGRWQERTPPLMKGVPAWQGRRQELFEAWERARKKAQENGGEPRPWQEPRVPKTIALPGKNTKACPFCFDRVRRAGHKEVVLVEGVFDAAFLQVTGETRACASVAASLSGEQLKTLVRCRVERVFICGDPDGGGDRGTLANADALAAAGIPAYVVGRLPEGEDPDQFVRRAGLDAWREHIDRSDHCFRHRARVVLAGQPDREPGDDLWCDQVVRQAMAFAERLGPEHDDELRRHFWPEVVAATGADVDEVLRRTRARRADPGRNGKDTGHGPGTRPRQDVPRGRDGGEQSRPWRRGFRFDVLDSPAFAAADYRLEWMVRRLLVRGQPIIVGGPRKALKTSIVVDLAVSLATGTDFLSTF
jgi:putative DNA primase/helicase